VNNDIKKKVDKTQNLIWIDMEFTGLADHQVILEMACLITDKDLKIISKGMHVVVHRSEAELTKIEEWSLNTHTASGLMEKVKHSTISIEDADKMIVEHISQYTVKRKAILCGNSIHTDRRFIHREMPLLDTFLHYRMVDVTSVKELIERWYPEKPNTPAKKNSHAALDDIKESLSELQWYKDHFFVAIA
jgi:oligoribonuclease|tara:strand:+ start:99 stop:668 length:570 start_codon:yes stop_codon:yes gene_type:complete